jgi:hypothetical protein
VEATADEEAWEPSADEGDRLSVNVRDRAHLLITAQYETQRRALPPGGASQQRSPLAEVLAQVTIAARG